MIVFWLWRAATLLARIIPLQPSYACAAAMADLVFLCWREKRKATIDNMRHVLPEAEPALVYRVARRSWRNYAKYLVDFIRAPKIQPEDLNGKLVFDRWELVDAARAEGKGLIFVSMHIGNWDMGGLVLTNRGYPVNVIADTVGSDRLNAMIVAARTLGGMKVIPIERAAASIVRALRRNEVLALLMDRPMADGGIKVRFFDRETVLPAGPARLALRTGARVIPVALVRVKGSADRLRALVEPELRIERTGDIERDVRAYTEAILAAQERFIRRFPDQWYMFRRMWPREVTAP